MKTHQKRNLLTLIILVGVLITSCVKSDEFDLPEVTTTDPGITANTTFKAVKERFEQEGEMATFNETEPLYIEGYVISSDKAGNFYKHIIIQNKTDESSDATYPRMGLRIDLNTTSLYEKYELGRKVYIKLNELSIGMSHGVLVIGKSTNGKISQIPAYLVDDVVIRSTEITTITPKATTVSTLIENDINTLIQLTDMQFTSANLSQTYAGESHDRFSGDRNIESCVDGSSMLLSTSTFSDFKSVTLAQGNGTITAVLSKDFSGKNTIVLIRDRDDIVFDGSRCQALFQEEFQHVQDNTDFNFEGWINFAETGTKLWSEQEFGGNGYAEFGAFHSGDQSNISWLITPGIVMDSQIGESLTFKTAQHHISSKENTLEVFVSTNFDGANVLAATWKPIGATLATGNDSNYKFINSGSIDLSSYSGTLYLAFKYTGSGKDSDLDGAYMVDDIKIVAQ